MTVERPQPHYRAPAAHDPDILSKQSEVPGSMLTSQTRAVGDHTPEAAEDARSRGGQGAEEGSGMEARSGDQSARSAEKIFRLHFSVIRMGSRGAFVLCTDAPESMLSSN